MPKLGFFVTIASITSILGALMFATLAAPAAADGTACVHTEFKTELVKQACAKGGQKEAKEVMKKFMKDNNIKSCNDCHTKLAPKYENKPDALEKFQKLGGK